AAAETRVYGDVLLAVDEIRDRARDRRALHRHLPQQLAARRAEDRQRLLRRAFDDEITRRRQHTAVAVARQRHLPCGPLPNRIPRRQPGALELRNLLLQLEPPLQRVPAISSPARVRAVLHGLERIVAG